VGEADDRCDGAELEVYRKVAREDAGRDHEYDRRPHHPADQRGEHRIDDRRRLDRRVAVHRCTHHGFEHAGGHHHEPRLQARRLVEHDRAVRRYAQQQSA